MSKLLKVLGAALIIISLVMAVVYYANIYNVEGYAYIHNVSENTEECYLGIEMDGEIIKVYCTEEERKIVLENPDSYFHIKYSYNGLFPDKGKLKQIEVDYFIR